MTKKKGISPEFIEQVRDRIKTYFLYTTFVNPRFLKGELSKHLEVAEDTITLNETQQVTNDQGDVTCLIFGLTIFGCNYALQFKRRITPSREVQVPRIVKNEHKWYQVDQPDTKLVVETKKTAEMEYWVLSAID